MNVILKETIESLGIIGSEVKVADGYARNYLLPQKKAILATVQNRKLMTHQKAKLDLQIAKERGVAEEMAKTLQDVVITIPAKVSDENRLYGSITTRDILNALAEKEITVDKKMILLSEPIKTLGSFQVPIRVYKEVEPTITVEIIPES
ncbi:MAG: 50S ribosomal protein L9 [Desulfatirhabdiaceae bacterium]